MGRSSSSSSSNAAGLRHGLLRPRGSQPGTAVASKLLPCQQQQIGSGG